MGFLHQSFILENNEVTRVASLGKRNVGAPLYEGRDVLSRDMKLSRCRRYGLSILPPCISSFVWPSVSMTHGSPFHTVARSLISNTGQRRRLMYADRRYFLTLAFVLSAFLASGCTNLGAVREFAARSAGMTGYQAVTEHYVSSANRQLVDLPADQRFDATRKKLQTLETITAQDKATLLKLHATTTGYLSALAQLAGDGAYSISPEINQVSGAIQVSETLKINGEHVSAYSDIAQRVTDWALAAKQARSVEQLVKENGADMDKLLEAMQLATQAYGIVLQQEIQSYDLVTDYRQAQWSAKLPGDAGLTPERREVIATLLRRSALADTSAQQQALQAQQAAAAGLDQVREAHLVMLQNVDRLSAKDIQGTLRQAASDLRSTRQSISDL